MLSYRCSAHLLLIVCSFYNFQLIICNLFFDSLVNLILVSACCLLESSLFIRQYVIILVLVLQTGLPGIVKQSSSE